MRPEGRGRRLADPDSGEEEGDPAPGTACARRRARDEKADQQSISPTPTPSPITTPISADRSERRGCRCRALGDPAAGLSRRYIIQQVEQSLRRLRTDRIDLYYAHFPDPDTPLEQTLAVYDDLIRQGKLGYVALSNYPPWQLTEALWIADDRRMVSAPVCVQVRYSLMDRSAEAELAPPACASGYRSSPAHRCTAASWRIWRSSTGRSPGTSDTAAAISIQHARHA